MPYSISPTRIKKIKSSTVQILVDHKVSGSGFFINEQGSVLTNWHVIQHAFKVENTTNIIQGLYAILAKTNTGDPVRMGIPDFFVKTIQNQAYAYDFVLLQPKEPINGGFDFLELGDFDSASEGQEVYTCGFPFGKNQEFVSKGFISTIYSEISAGLEVDMAQIDMTMNKGNSGGAMILMGDDEEQDKVIGLSSFIINSIGDEGDKLIKYFMKGAGMFKLQGIDPNRAFAMITQYISHTSNGISGCISINHFKKIMQDYNFSFHGNDLYGVPRTL